MTKTKLKVTRSGRWRPDLVLLRLAAEGPIRDFAQGPLSVQVEIGGPVVANITFESSGEWPADTGLDITSIFASVRDHEAGRSFVFFWRRTSESASIEVESSDTNDGKAASLRVADALMATLQIGGLAEFKKAERIFAPQRGNPNWVQAAIGSVKALVGPSASFRGDITIEDTKFSVESSHEWLQNLPAAKSWVGRWADGSDQVVVDHDPESERLRIELQSYDDAWLSEGLARIDKLPGLRPRPAKVHLSGDSRRYFLQSEASELWYERAHSSIGAFTDRSFWGRISKDGEHATERGYGVVEEWWSQLQQALATGVVSKSFASYRSWDRVVTFELDHRRDLLNVDLQSLDAIEVAEKHQSLALELGLKTAPREAYRYRKWGQTRKIVWKSNESFARSLSAGLAAMFPKRRAALAQASLHTGASDEEVHSFRTLEGFLSYLQDEARNLRELHLIAEGPRGEFAGVHVDRKLTRMRLLVNTEKYRAFKALQNVLCEGVLSSSPSEDLDLEPTYGASSRDVSGRFAWLPTVAVALIGFVGTLIGSEFYKAVRESPELRVLAPPTTDGRASILGTNLTIRWAYVVPHAFGSPDVFDHYSATVEVTRRPSGERVPTTEQEGGRARIQGLAPGAYHVLVMGTKAYQGFDLDVSAADPGASAQSETSGASMPSRRGDASP
jgi:hypothetical protein